MHATQRPALRVIGPARISYSTAHDRVKRAKGRAREYPCISCGAQAANWAYDHCDPDARYDVQTGAPFSLDVDHYDPMCLSCHRILDLNRPVAMRGAAPHRPAKPLPPIPEDELRARVAARRADLLATHTLCPRLEDSA